MGSDRKTLSFIIVFMLILCTVAQIQAETWLQIYQKEKINQITNRVSEPRHTLSPPAHTKDEIIIYLSYNIYHFL